MLKSFCKINLSLRVLNKKNNGYHNIQSNSFLINLYDEIKITQTKKKNDQIIFRGKFNKFIHKKNTVVDTLQLLRKLKLINIYKKYKIVIKKNIPVFSGMGGGTSNAAYIINYFLKGKLKKNFTKKFEKIIGSDLKLFEKKQVFQKTLHKILEYKKNYKFHFILIYPGIKCSTKEIYSKVKKYSNPSKVKYNLIKDKFSFLELLSKERNDLQSVAVKKFPIIKKIIDLISEQKGCNFARMTGSGSVCFGVFNSIKSAKNALDVIKKKHPKYWCIITKTI